jgi:hypothetical protein
MKILNKEVERDEELRSVHPQTLKSQIDRPHFWLCHLCDMAISGHEMNDIVD